MSPEESPRPPGAPGGPNDGRDAPDAAKGSGAELTVPTFDAVLLAAGRSERMGRDKALISGSWGPTLWERQWQLLEAVGARHRWLSVRPEQTWAPRQLATVRDSEAGGGPLAGILAAWEASRASHLLVLAVDLPLLPGGWFTALQGRCAPGTGAAGRHTDGRFEPLAAIYPRAWRARWTAEFQSGARSLQRLLSDEARDARLSIHPISPAETHWFANVNTPADLPPPR